MDLIAGLERCLPGTSVSGLAPLSAGWETDVYGFVAGGKPLVLRVYSGGDVWKRAAAEARALQLLHSLSYPVPRLAAFGEDPALFGGAYLIMERIDGQVMWRHYGDATRAPAQMRTFCSLLHRLHGLDAGAFGLDTPSTFDLSILRLLAGELREPFEPVFALLERQEPFVGRERRSLIHGDFHHENILIGPGEAPYVIDWSCAALEDPRADVAQSIVLAITNGSPDLARLIQSGYAELNGGPLPHLDHFMLRALARRVMTIVVTMVCGSGAIGLRPGLEHELRKAAPRVRQLVGLLEEMSGVQLPGVYGALDGVLA